MADVGVAARSSGIHPQADSPLAKISLEVLVRITYFITTEDLCKLRTTCKAIERALFDFFSSEFFTKKQFMASPFSLQALVDISKHAYFSARLKHIIICTDRYEDIHVATTYDRQRMLNEARNAHYNLMSTGLLRDYLAEAFTNLPNLETVDIRDFNSPTRSRESSSASGSSWTSYGVRRLTRDIGYPPAVHGGSDHPINNRQRSMLFQGMVAALGVANARPNSLEVVMRSHGLDDSSYFIPPRLETPISQMLAGLKKLHMVLLPPRTGIQPFLQWDLTNTQKFLLHVPNVTWLRINLSNRFTSPQQYIDAVQMLCWIAGLESNGKTRLRPGTDMPSFQLDTLDLGNMRLRPAPLEGLVRHFSKTLQNLSFRRVTLTTLREEEQDKVNLWAGLIRSFGKLENLRKLSLAQLKQGDNRVNMPHPTEPGKLLNERTLREASSQKLADLAAGMVSPAWPAPPPPTEMDIDDDEEEDEDEEEEEEDDDDEDDT